MGYGSDIDLIDLDQANELTSDKNLLRTALRETSSDFLITVEPDTENVTREQQANTYIVKQMLSSTHVATLSIGSDTVSVVEPNLLYMEMPSPDVRAQYIATANPCQAVAA